MNRRLTSVILTIILLAIPCVHALGQQDMPFDPAQLADLSQATLYMNLPVPDLPNSGTFVRTLTNPEKLAKLAKLLSEAEKMDHGSGCGFEKDIAFLVLRTKDGQDIRLSPAPDSCTVYQINGAYYYFMPKAYRGKPEHPDNRILYDLFDPKDPQVTESSDAAAEFARLLETVKAERLALSPIWGHPIINADVWDYVASSPHRHQTYEQLQAAFGTHMAFWPIEIKLLYALRKMNDVPAYGTVPSLPYFRDMQADAALAMAQKELDACADIPKEVKARLKPDMNFTYTERDMTYTWHIMFRDPEDPSLAVLYSVMIDQETRQITESIGPNDGNG